MPYLIVFALAAGIGAAVYVLSMRDRPWNGLVDGGGADLPAAPPPGSYVPVSPTRTDWQTRLTGLAGLIVAVVAGAALLAIALYASVSAVVRLFDGLVGGETSP